MISRIAFSVTISLLTSINPAVSAGPAVIEMTENQSQVNQWNRFSDAIYELHKKNIEGRKIREKEEYGSWGGEFARHFTYRDVSYQDAESGRLLSRIRRDAEKPDNIQTIEVYVHDKSGRVIRDYAALYLPWGRNAPVRTFINLHQYREGVHGFRQFDASGDRLYEECRGKLAGHEVNISLEDYQIDSKVISSKTYQSCFQDLPKTADDYLIPH